MNVERAQPLREGASSSGIDVFPNVEHSSIITHTLALTVNSGIGRVTLLGESKNAARNGGPAGRRPALLFQKLVVDLAFR
jgi:hypothetical protein